MTRGSCYRHSNHNIIGKKVCNIDMKIAYYVLLGGYVFYCFCFGSVCYVPMLVAKEITKALFGCGTVLLTRYPAWIPWPWNAKGHRRNRVDFSVTV